MRWSERQLAMLEAIGVRLWLPAARAEAGRVPAAAAPAGVDADPAVDSDDFRADGAARATAAAVPGRPTGAAPVAGPGGALAATPALPVRPAPPAAVAAPGDVATMDWAALRDAVAGCTACRLCESRRQTVFGVGPLDAHWMVVGEAPGEQEDREGEPFVGKSGQLLDNMLRAIGVSRRAPAAGEGDADPARQVYIANTIKCRPPGNRNPAPDELARCEAYLVRQVELVRPRIILAMGRFAVQALLKSSEPVGRLRGRVHRYHGVPLVVTYHPAYLLRNLDDKARAWDDLCLAVETAAAERAA